MRLRFFFVTSLFVFAAACGRDGNSGALVNKVYGQAQIEHAGKSVKLEAGAKVATGDIIRTGADGVVLLVFRANQASAEIQPNSVFEMKEADGKTDLNLTQGNVWLQVNKLQNKHELTLHTPTTVAGVRGTKFFTAVFGDTVAVCHCQGDVEFSAGKYKEMHHTDQVVFTRGSKTLVFQPRELPFAKYEHSHSALDDSPLGKKDTITPEVQKQMIAFLDKKFAEMK